MRIAVCDDKLYMLKDIEKLVNEYVQENQDVHFEVQVFLSAGALLDSGIMFDIYIMDIIMPEMTGIELGKEVQKKNPAAFLIYLTSSKEFALDAFEIHAQRYILKPVDKEKLFEALDYGKKLTSIPQKIFSVKTADGMVSLRIDEIEFVELASRKTIFHLSDGSQVESVYVRSSFETEVKDIAQEEGFVFVGKSYLINMKYISKIDSERIRFGIYPEGIYISKRNIPEIKRVYLEYLANYNG